MRPYPFVLFALCACGDSRSPEQRAADDRAAKEPAYIAVQENRIRDKLKDPKSAEFRNVHVYYAIAPVVCGEVNSRNSFGGMNGFQRFISGGDIQVLDENMARGEMDQSWAKICR